MPPAEIVFSPWVLAVLGLCIGSFLNVVIHRLPLMLERGWK
ncbi:MAG: prepilin peptidase, partial [Caldimonas sp.]